MDEIAALKQLVLDMLPWIAHRDQCPTPDWGTECTCGTSDVLQRALDAVSPLDVAPPTGHTEIQIQVDTRPRCNAPHTSGGTLACDKPRGHDDSHGAYYGYTGREESWS